MKIKAKILQYSLGPIGSALISLIILPIVAWLYNIEDVAKYSIFQAILLLYTLVFSFGLDQAFIRNYFDINNKNKLLYNIGIGVVLPSLFFLLVVLFFFASDFSYWVYGEGSVSLTFLTLISCLFSLIIRLLSSIQRMKDEAILFSLSQIIPKFIFLFLIILFTFFLPKNFINIVLAQFISLLMVTIYLIIINRKYIFEALKENKDINMLKSYFVYGFPLIFAGILIWGLKISDRFYLKFLSNLEQLGLYSMAVSIAGAAGIFVSVFNVMWAPLVYRWVNQSDLYAIEVKRKVEDIALKASFFILIISSISIFGSHLVPYFLPDEYKEIRYILPLCVLSVLLFTFSEVTSIGINLTKKTKYTLYSCFFTIVVHIILSFLFIPYWGAEGAAVAGLLSTYVFILVRSFFSDMVWVKLKLFKSNIFIIISFIFVLLNFVQG